MPAAKGFVGSLVAAPVICSGSMRSNRRRLVDLLRRYLRTSGGFASLHTRRKQRPSDGEHQPAGENEGRRECRQANSGEARLQQDRQYDSTYAAPQVATT